LGLIDHVGSLRVASSPEQFKELQRSVSRAKGIGMDVEIISPAEAIKIMPALSEKDLYGAIYLPRDGHLDPYLTTTSMAAKVKEMGVTIYTNTRVTGLELSPQGEIARVLTDKGAIRTEIVINAAGAWAGSVSEMAGIKIPVVPDSHEAAITEPVARFFDPMIVDIHPDENSAKLLFLPALDRPDILLHYTISEHLGI